MHDPDLLENTFVNSLRIHRRHFEHTHSISPSATLSTKFKVSFSFPPPNKSSVCCPATLENRAYPSVCSMESPSSGSYHMPIVPQILVGFHAHLCLHPDSISLEPVLVLCMFSQLLRVCAIALWYLKNSFFGVIHHPGILLYAVSSLSHGAQSGICITHLGLSTQYLILCMQALKVLESTELWGTLCSSLSSFGRLTRSPSSGETVPWLRVCTVLIEDGSLASMVGDSQPPMTSNPSGSDSSSIKGTPMHMHIYMGVLLLLFCFAFQ